MKGASKAARKRERGARRFVEHFLSAERVYFVQGLPCVRCGKGPCANHHEPTKATGGTYLDLSPVCHPCHNWRHNIGVITFWKSVGVTYEESNAATEAAWLGYVERAG